MTRRRLKRSDSLRGSEGEFIAIYSDMEIGFNAVFVRKANLKPGQRVAIEVDEKEREIYFIFDVKEDDLDVYKLTSASAGSDREKRQGLTCGAKGELQKFDWIVAVAKLSDKKDKRFSPQKIGKDWVIRLAPAFERSVNRNDILSLPSGTWGIYRYWRNNEIVYIGRGDIRQRLLILERRGWDFNKIEYSIIDNEKERATWEHYWHEKYKDKYDKLPIYNKLLGSINEIE